MPIHHYTSYTIVYWNNFIQWRPQGFARGIREAYSIFLTATLSGLMIYDFWHPPEIKKRRVGLEQAASEGTMGCLFTSPKSLIIMFSYRWLNNFYWIVIGWFIKLSVQTFQPLIVINRRDNFVYHYWECTSIYLPLSYPFRSLGL